MEGDAKSEDTINYIEYKADKQTFACHIEYVLAPEEEPKSVDVICWESVAKIYVEENSAAIIPLSFDKIRWIYFRVKHVITINNESVCDYYNHNIVVTASVDGKRLGQAAKSEKVKIFYGLCEGDESELFPALWENVKDIKSVVVNFNDNLSTNFERNLLSNKLRNVLRNLTREYDKGVHEATEGTEKKLPPWKSINETNCGVGDTVKTKTNWKTITRKNGNEPETELSFILSGESVLSGLKIFERCVKYKSKELPYFYSVAQIEDASDLEQAKYYNPMSITLKRLKFLPVEAMEKENIRKIRFSFAVFDKYQTESNDIKINENILLDYTRTILTGSIGTPDVIEFIQTKGLDINMMGITDEVDGNEEEKVKPFIYNDQRINSKSGLPGTFRKDIISTSTEPVFLARAKIDISSILFEPHRLSIKCNFNYREPNRKSESEFYNTVNATEVNYRSLKRNNLCDIIISSSAVLSISVRLCFPAWTYLDRITTWDRIRDRMLVITNDMNTIMNVLQTIAEENKILAPTDYSMSATRIDRPITIYHNSTEASGPDPGTVLVGFLIDCVEYCLIYIEGPKFGVFQEIWSVASILQPAKGRVLYDSSLIFNHVSHKDLIRYGGFYVISLQRPPESLLIDEKTYKEGNIPVPAYNAIIKLHHLSQCQSIATVIRNDLLPDYTSLLSLDLEFGVTLKFSNSFF